jgi:hypothetical protein
LYQLSFAVPIGYWSQIGSRPDNATDTAERILATYGLNLYDASVWSIAVALGGHFDRARSITTMLLLDTCGELNSLHGCRGFYYGDSLWTCPNDTTTGYFFRMISDTYANIDPLTGDRVPWMDWRPVRLILYCLRCFFLLEIHFASGEWRECVGEFHRSASIASSANHFHRRAMGL